MTKIPFTHEEKRIIGLSALGGMLEFYDFMIYGIFSVYFAPQFFPNTNVMISVIQSYTIFIIGYIARPIGGIIFSHMGDEYGRKKVLIITIILMGLSSLGIGVLPTYNTINIAAPLILLALRLTQGLALGGELPSTFVYISESITHKRSIAFGIAMSGVASGLLLGITINNIMNALLNTDELNNYGWRIPFILGGILCLVSYKIRKSLHETAAFQKMQNKPQFPLLYLIKNYFLQLISGTLLASLMAAGLAISVIFMPTYLHTILKINTQLVSQIMLFAVITNVITVYTTGIISNKFSPQIILRNLLFISMLIIPTSYWIIHTGYGITIGVIMLVILQSIAAMITPLLITQLFPVQIRLTGVAMCYNLGTTIFSGFTPLIISTAIKSGANVFITPMLFLIVIVIVCSIGLIYFNILSKNSTTNFNMH